MLLTIFLTYIKTMADSRRRRWNACQTHKLATEHLRDAKINKKFGFTAAYLFQLVFVLLFHQNKWFRLLENNKAVGGLFYLLCDEVSTIDWVVALQQLLELINEVATRANKKLAKLIKSQLQQWIAGLPSYLKAYLPIQAAKFESLTHYPLSN